MATRGYSLHVCVCWLIGQPSRNDGYSLHVCVCWLIGQPSRNDGFSLHVCVWWLIGQPSRIFNNVDWVPTLSLAPSVKTDDDGMCSGSC